MINRRKLLALGAAAAAQPAIARAAAINARVRTGTIKDVEHVVILMQENRAFDHYFGTLKGVRGFGDRFTIPQPGGRSVWEQLDLDPKEAMRQHDASEVHTRFKKRLFSRIVPTVKDIGLWSERVQRAYADLGVLQYGERDAQEALDQDAKIAEEFDRLLQRRTV